MTLSELAEKKLNEEKQDRQDRQDRQNLNTEYFGGVECLNYGAVQDVVSATNWAWLYWIPNGYLTMLAAEAGKGKSYLALWLAKTFISGGTLPDGTTYVPADADGKILWCDTEYAQGMTLERAQNIGLSVKCIITPLLNPLDAIDLGDQDHRERLKVLGNLPQVRILVIDSLSGAHSGKENDTGEMKEICAWLADLAQEIRKPVLCLHHFNKLNFGNELPSISKIRGSSAIIQFFRSIIGIDCPDISQPNRKRLSVIKSNLGAYPDLLGFEIADGGHELIFMNAPDAPRKTTEYDRALLWLADYLKNEIEQSKVIADGLSAGLKKRTIERAKAALGVSSRKEWNSYTHEAKWFWSPKKQDRQELLCEKVGGVGGVGGVGTDNVAAPDFDYSELPPRYKQCENYSEVDL